MMNPSSCNLLFFGRGGRVSKKKFHLGKWHKKNLCGGQFVFLGGDGGEKGEGKKFNLI